jgi:iron complex outermembrane receptor protein
MAAGKGKMLALGMSAAEAEELLVGLEHSVSLAAINAGGYLDNQADYGDGVTIDLQAFTYSIFSQHTFQMPGGFTGEVSGYFAGPGVWGGVFEYKTSGALNLGLQKKFLNDQMNVKLSANDILFTSPWRGTSEFNGLVSSGRGAWDSRRVALSISYNFGNQKVKSRKRNTGLEDEASRVGSK